MTQPIRVLIADDHPVFRAGLKQILASAPGFTLTGEAEDGELAVSLCRSLKPDVALLDFDLPKLNGLQVVKELERMTPPPKFLFLTLHNEETLLKQALDSGVAGYLLKDNAVSDLLTALRTVAQGGIYLSPALSAHLVRRVQRTEALSKQSEGLASLTPTERRILREIAANKTSREIAKELFVSHRTVETHRANICEKLGLRGSHKLLQFAIENRAVL